jgi:hypothetical protein
MSQTMFYHYKGIVMGWVVAPQKVMSPAYTRVPVNVTLLEEGVFLDVIKLRILRWAYPRLTMWTHLSREKCPWKTQGKDTEEETWRWQQMGVVQQLPRSAWSLWKLAGASQKSLLSQPGKASLITPWFWTSGLRTYVRITAYFKPWSLWSLVETPRKLTGSRANKTDFWTTPCAGIAHIVKRLALCRKEIAGPPQVFFKGDTQTVIFCPCRQQFGPGPDAVFVIHSGTEVYK